MKLRDAFVVATLACAAASASAGTYTSAGGAIPDNQPASPLVVTFNVTESGPLSSLSLLLGGLTHTWAGDLIVTLTAPNGTVADIMRRPTTAALATSTIGDSSNFNGDYTFIDSGADLGVALAGGTSGFDVPSGSYQASTRVGATANSFVSLNATFGSTPVFGTWTLRLSDSVAADTGALTSASLTVSAVPEPSAYLTFGLGLAGLAMLRRRQAV